MVPILPRISSRVLQRSKSSQLEPKRRVQAARAANNGDPDPENFSPLLKDMVGSLLDFQLYYVRKEIWILLRRL